MDDFIQNATIYEQIVIKVYLATFRWQYQVIWYFLFFPLFQGFYYDAFYGDLALNEEHFDQIKSQAMKAVAVWFTIIYSLMLLLT